MHSGRAGRVFYRNEVAVATDYQAIMLALARGDSWARITEDVGCSRRTIDKASRAMKMHGLSTVNDVEALSRTVLAGMFPDNRVRNDEEFVTPDFQKIADKYATGKRVTLKVEHARYLGYPAGPGQRHYSYKQFCALFSRFVDVNSLTARITHVPGEEMYVDWAGDTMSVVDPITGKVFPAYVFVASLPHSGMVFARCYPDMRMASWLYAHQDAFSYFGGRPVRVVPDNASTATNQLFQGSGVRDVNQEYFRFGVHFGVGITPARARKPRDKAHVEKASTL